MTSMILGVTGGIAAGKSSVSEEFRQLGAAVVSADELARAIVQPGSPVLKQLVAHFGTGILAADGTLDRGALGRKIFADPRARRTVNDITHPAIARLAEKRLAELKKGRAPLVVYEAPLLFEAGARRRVDAVLVVKIDPAVQLQRLMAREKIDAAAARRRVAAQMPQEEKIVRADYVIDNSGDPQQTRAQVRELFARLRAGPPGAGPPGTTPSG